MEKLFVLFLLFGTFVSESTAQPSQCPPNNENAKVALKGFIDTLISNGTLKKDYGVDYDSATIEMVRPLTNEKYYQECKELKSKFESFKDNDSHSFYVFADYYFVIKYMYTNEGKFRYNEITIIDSGFNHVGTNFNLEY